MQKFFKQLFCSHIYKKRHLMDLGTEVHWTSNDPYSDTYLVSAIKLKCIKCNKQKITKDYIRI